MIGFIFGDNNYRFKSLRDSPKFPCRINNINQLTLNNHNLSGQM